MSLGQAPVTLTTKVGIMNQLHFWEYFHILLSEALPRTDVQVYSPNIWLVHLKANFQPSCTFWRLNSSAQARSVKALPLSKVSQRLPASKQGWRQVYSFCKSKTLMIIINCHHIKNQNKPILIIYCFFTTTLNASGSASQANRSSTDLSLKD